ncbi:MAG: rhodanese-like domain-containing protein [Gemmatimonadetes bacterium]|nr:rhodanese-like domain-containing protein [Gemmatimonadota bacterium]
MAPFALVDVLGKPLAYALYFLIGVAFGAVLEMAGFADSRRLAAQFYFRNLTVLKVMFGAIVTAMVLLFLTSALGWVDMQRVWVNPTYLVPGVVGGLVMGVGFILGGFCPGTSLVAVANLKLDALFFFVGATLGVGAFGETVGRFPEFFYSTSLGRFTLPQWLGVPTGVVVVGVVLMALFMFWGSEQLEARFGHTDAARYPGAALRAPTPVARRRRRVAGFALLGGALIVAGLGQPTLAQRWESVRSTRQVDLETRAAYVHPGEVVDLSQDRTVSVLVLDLRDEAEFNVFHLLDSKRVTMDEIEGGLVGLRLLAAPPSTVTVLVDDREARSTQAWKLLVAGGVPNVYILEGGIDRWLTTFAPGLTDGTSTHFAAALGAGYREANPDHLVGHGLEYESKVKLQTRRKLGGGCG